MSADSLNRKLSVIMFADMVGYTAMVQSNEQLARKKRQRHHSELKSCVQKHGGNIVQFYGDGSLTSFESALKAADCALDLQNRMLQDPIIDLRIGLHMGDVIIDEDGIFGDSVNVASRIESLGTPGSVLISSKIADELSNHPFYNMISMGSFNFKNVTYPMEVHALVSGLVQVPDPTELKGKTKNVITSLAVLPFVNLSNDVDNEYFCDGVTEELISTLSKLDGIKVTSRTSSFHFKGKSSDVRDIAKVLQVESILEGSIRRSSNKVRISAQLINAKDGCHIWSDKYDREIVDIFDMQDEIAEKISLNLSEKLGQKTHEKESGPKISNIDSYNAYLKGRYYWSKYTPDSVKIAIQEFDKAIELDPSFSKPYASKSSCLCFLGALGIIPFEDCFETAEEAALKSLENNPNSENAFLALALIHLFFYKKFDRSEEYFQKALALNNGSAEVYQAYGYLLSITQRFEEYLVNAQTTVELDPISPLVLYGLAEAHFFNKNYKKSISICDQVLALDPNFRTAIEGKGWAYYMDGKIEESIECLKQLPKMLNCEYKGITGLGFVYGKSGRKEEALKCLKLLDYRQTKEPNVILWNDYAIIHAGLGNQEMTMEYLYKSYDAKLAGLVFIRNNVAFNDMIENVDYRNFLTKLGF